MNLVDFIHNENAVKYPNFYSQLQSALALEKEVQQFHPCLSSVLYSEENGKYYPQNVIVFLNVEPPMSIHYGFNKKYSIRLRNIGTLANITRMDLQRIQSSFEIPNNIGKLNLKKIQAWTEYYTKVWDELVKLDILQGDNKIRFYESITGMPIDWDLKHKSGTIIKNGIELKFQESESYVSVNLSINYNVKNTVDSFIQLSENSFSEVKESTPKYTTGRFFCRTCGTPFNLFGDELSALQEGFTVIHPNLCDDCYQMALDPEPDPEYSDADSGL